MRLQDGRGRPADRVQPRQPLGASGQLQHSRHRRAVDGADQPGPRHRFIRGG